MTVVIDTNVILAANGQHDEVSAACVAACGRRLDQIKNTGRIAIDDRFRILSEYLRRTTPRRQKGPGDAFVYWALQNKANTKRCDQVCLSDHAERGFESFPDDQRLNLFDRADRKFVAVARAHPDAPPILQATDSKWVAWAPALQEHGVTVDFLCSKDIQQFHKNKTGE